MEEANRDPDNAAFGVNVADTGGAGSREPRVIGYSGMLINGPPLIAAPTTVDVARASLLEFNVTGPP